MNNVFAVCWILNIENVPFFMVTEIQEVTAQTKHQNVIILHIYWEY